MCTENHELNGKNEVLILKSRIFVLQRENSAMEGRLNALTNENEVMVVENKDLSEKVEETEERKVYFLNKLFIPTP